MTLEKHITAAEDYVKTWKSYQTLWDIEASHVYNILEENIDKWHQLLNEIRQGRKTFDNSETEKTFGAIIIYYGGVQAKVNNKYDQWHKDILNKFGITISENMRNFNSTI
jgi:dynein heavy chain 1